MDVTAYVGVCYVIVKPPRIAPNPTEAKITLSATRIAAGSLRFASLQFVLVRAGSTEKYHICFEYK
jgi:hypothetical protein